jgi:hypothetical protein
MENFSITPAKRCRLEYVWRQFPNFNCCSPLLARRRRDNRAAEIGDSLVAPDVRMEEVVIGSSLEVVIGSSLEMAIDDSLEVVIDDLLEVAIDDSLEAAIDNSLEAAIDNSLEAAIDNSLEAAINNSLKEAIDEIAPLDELPIFSLDELPKAGNPTSEAWANHKRRAREAEETDGLLLARENNVLQKRISKIEVMIGVYEV